MRELALFDFDGTITTDDSLFKFIRFAKGDLKTLLGLIFLSPMLVVFKLKLIPNYKAKQMMLSYFFKGMDEQVFKAIAKAYSLNHADKIVRKNALAKIKWHKEQGHEVAVVSASMECWLKPWCDKHQLEVLSTQLAFKNQVFTGKFASNNCYGIEKVNRIKAKYQLDQYQVIHAYGDTKGDKDMLAIAHKSYYRHF